MQSAAGERAPRLRINYTICADNLDQLEDFFAVFGQYRIDTIQLRPIADYGDTTYTNKDLTPQISAYNKAIEQMMTECRGARHCSAGKPGRPHPRQIQSGGSGLSGRHIALPQPQQSMARGFSMAF